MERDIIKIDEFLCNGCGLCIPNCHEGALQIIDGKVRLVSELMCDGLGACIGHCPQKAISIEKREAKPYNERLVMKDMVTKGKNTIIAHLKHLKDHNETGFLNEGIAFLRENADNIDFDIQEVINVLNDEVMKSDEEKSPKHAGGCPGAKAMSFGAKKTSDISVDANSLQSELRQWPIQMHLINPNASYFKKADVVLAADCVAFSLGNFHQKFLKDKRLGVACPKLDANQEVYINKIKMMIDEAEINTLTVMIMEVPCCGGLLQMTKRAATEAERKVPIKLIIVGIQGDIIKEEWV